MSVLDGLYIVIGFLLLVAAYLFGKRVGARAERETRAVVDTIKTGVANIAKDAGVAETDLKQILGNGLNAGPPPKP